MADWLTTVMSVAVGGSLSIAGGWFSDLRLSKRERERRTEEQRDRKVAKLEEFQRECLLGLQDTCQQLLRVCGKIHHHNVLTWRQTGEWGRSQLPEDFSDDYQRFNTQALLLASRIRDNELRNQAEALRATLVRAILSENESDADRLLEEAVSKHSQLIEQIGARVRQLDTV